MPRNTGAFAAVVRRRLDELGLTQLDVADRGGPSDSTLRKILDGEPVNIAASTLRKLDAPLDWQAGSAAKWLSNPPADGGMPPVLSQKTGDLTPIPQSTGTDTSIGGDPVTARYSPVGLGRGLASLIPTEFDPEAWQQGLDSETAIVEEAWSAVHELVEAVLESNPSNRLRGAAQEIISKISATTIVRILTGRYAPQLEGWLARIYRERDQLHRALADSATPWVATELSPEEAAHSAVQHATSWPTYFSKRTADPHELSDQSLSAVEAIVSQSLAEHHAEMRRRAREQARHQALVHQAWSSLGDDHNQQQSYAPEIGDGQYARYLAARLSTPHQGGDPDLHAQLPMTDAEYDAAQARYRREFAEMVVFDGSIRTVMRTPAGNTPSRDATSSLDDTKPALPEVESRLRGSASGGDASKRSS
ncbi:helix-turn-helix domain-containing protein [Mycobacteroides immunogenum]|uniref:helix-turn-helix domain-containing protein n=1 Tax=Mycobacteroides immunogenum TaxID=83262 RepID=UPI0006970AE5|nr:helix-turn-helix transcriptional regulator [Mycobacteroides immunogenum]ANO05273.1 hypothetical protein BAB75_19690 [Mycobacteroides immunogenum]MCV7307422.1 transcriptional regulator [Mycobacteroides immunogenum]ORV76203.1 hypothetical protein AWC10_24400 [Mycobacteroides immunogenum]